MEDIKSIIRGLYDRFDDVTGVLLYVGISVFTIGITVLMTSLYFGKRPIGMIILMIVIAMLVMVIFPVCLDLVRTDREYNIDLSGYITSDELIGEAKRLRKEADTYSDRKSKERKKKSDLLAQASILERIALEHQEN